MQIFCGPFSQMGNSLGTNIEHMQSRCMAGGAKNPSFLAIFCSSACAHLLVHVRCPLIFFADLRSGQEKWVTTKGVFSLEKFLESLKSLNSLESLENESFGFHSLRVL